MGTIRGPGARLRLRAARLAGALLLAAACEHAQPFGAADLGPNAPFSTAFPRQLTWSALGDRDPAWLPDGSGIIYSFQLDRPDHDRCLGILPPEGGRQVRTICHAPPGDTDSTNALWSPAVGPGGSLAYVRESSPPGALAPDSRELVVATLDAPDPGRTILRFPYTAPDGTIHQTAAYLHWVDPSTLVYLAQQITYHTPPLGYDTVYVPVEVMELRLAGDSAVLTAVPGTANATSLAVDSLGAIYFTLAGDARVLSAPPGGAAAPVFDFTPLGPVQEVQVAGGRILAVTCCGLYEADLTNHTLAPIVVPAAWSIGRLALAPWAQRVVAEVRQGGDPADLWLLEVP